MKIAWFANGIPGTGGGRYYMELSNRLISKGHEVRFYLQDMGNDLGDKVKAEIRQLPQWREDSPHDVALCGDPGRGHVVGYVFDKVDIPKKFWCMNFYNGEFYPWVSNSSYTKIAQTHWFYHMARTADPSHNVELCLGGTDTKFWSYYEGHRSRGLLIYPKKSAWPGIEGCIKAMEKAPSLFIMRFGGEEAGYTSSDFPKNTINVGAPAHEMEKLRSAYHQALMYVNTESNYGWGFSQCIAEAMCCGAPVITGDTECFSDMAIHGETAITIPNDLAPQRPEWDWLCCPSSDDVCEAILMLAKDKDLRLKLARNARAHIEKFDYDIMADRLEEILSGNNIR